MTFSEILLDVYDRTGQSQTPPTEVARRIKRYVNRWNRRILSSQGMAALRRVTITKASVADQATYGIVLQKISYMTEATTQRTLTEKSIGWYRSQVPDPTAFTGTPDHYVPLGQARIHTRPANASELFIKSTEAADVGTVKVEAIRSNGYRVSLSKALTGTTAVSMSATITDIVDVVNVYLSAAQTGTVTLHEDSSTGTELSRIPIGQTFPRFLRFALAYTPSAAITYTIDGTADIIDMANDTDEPFPNPDFHDILIDGAVYEEWMNRGRASEAKLLLYGQNADRPSPDSIEGRIRRLRASLYDFSEGEDTRPRTFDETISLPIS